MNMARVYGLLLCIIATALSTIPESWLKHSFGGTEIIILISAAAICYSIAEAIDTMREKKK